MMGDNIELSWEQTVYIRIGDEKEKKKNISQKKNYIIS